MARVFPRSQIRNHSGPHSDPGGLCKILQISGVLRWVEHCSQTKGIVETGPIFGVPDWPGEDYAEAPGADPTD
jgi:hypothetical protein